MFIPKCILERHRIPVCQRVSRRCYDNKILSANWNGGKSHRLRRSRTENHVIFSSRKIIKQLPCGPCMKCKRHISVFSFLQILRCQTRYKFHSKRSYETKPYHAIPGSLLLYGLYPRIKSAKRTLCTCKEFSAKCSELRIAPILFKKHYPKFFLKLGYCVTEAWLRYIQISGCICVMLNMGQFNKISNI